MAGDTALPRSGNDVEENMAASEETGALAVNNRMNAVREPHTGEPHFVQGVNGVDALSIPTDSENRSEVAKYGEQRCGCNPPRSKYADHFEGFHEFAARMNEALRNLPSNHKQYDRVRVLVVFWEQSDPKSLKDYAMEVAELFGKVESDDDNDEAEDVEAEDVEDGEDAMDFGFEVMLCELKNVSQPQNLSLKRKNNNINNEFKAALDKAVEPLGENENDNDLFILYYIGHGVEHRISHEGAIGQEASRKYFWQPTRSSSIQLKWMDYEGMLRNADCDMLFIFDCCHASAMVSPREEWSRRCELLCSAGTLDQASARWNSSFTRAVVEELRKRVIGKGIDVYWFSLLLTEPKTVQYYELSPQPLWKRYSSGAAYQSSIYLKSKRVNDRLQPTISPTPLSDKDSAISMGQDLDSLNNTRILIRIRLTDPAEKLVFDDWMKWFAQRPSNVEGNAISLAIVDKIVCQAAFESGSSMWLVSIPIWVWGQMKPHPAYESLGSVRSGNIMLEAAVKEKDDILADTTQQLKASVLREKTALETSASSLKRVATARAREDQAELKREKVYVEKERAVNQMEAARIESQRQLALQREAEAKRIKAIEEREKKLHAHEAAIRAREERLEDKDRKASRQILRTAQSRRSIFGSHGNEPVLNGVRNRTQAVNKNSIDKRVGMVAF